MLKSLIKNVLYRWKIFSKWNSLPNGVYVFNYHRIGDAVKSDFDPNVYSCTSEVFEQHLAFYKDAFEVISADEISELAEKELLDKKRYALITFDDGYIDNYKIAYKALRKFNLPAAFYIATDYVDNPQIPWWDEIAWLVRHSKQNLITLPISPNETIDISKGTIVTAIRAILRLIKKDTTATMPEKVAQLEAATEVSLPKEVRKQSLFVNWDQIKEMSQNGMHIGSHTVNHNILSHLSEQDQLKELTDSKQRLEEFLGKPVTTIAYPVGGKSAFTTETMSITKEVGYELAFSFIAGFNDSLTPNNQYQLRRLPVDDNCSINFLKVIALDALPFK